MLASSRLNGSPSQCPEALILRSIDRRESGAKPVYDRDGRKRYACNDQAILDRGHTGLTCEKSPKHFRRAICRHRPIRRRET
jgi:hypothetical protein